jgi:hypothetical protein
VQNIGSISMGIASWQDVVTKYPSFEAANEDETSK